MRQIPIYKAEQEDGIADLIVANSSLSYITKASLKEMTPKPLDENTKFSSAIQNFVKSANQNQIDLYYINDIMVSCNWNDNDDVFIKEEVWPARSTCIDKPFNFEHKPREIIGHITEQFAINSKGEIIPDNTSLDDVPDDFDILNNTVIYRFHQDAEYKEKIDNTIAEIAKGDKWAVSMEALFSDYDYAIEDGEDVVIVARKKDTAFLSKFLKAYKGDGSYKGKRIGRVLKNITFCGKGLTDNPANSRSLIKGIQHFTVKAEKNYSNVLNLGYINLNEGENEMNEVELKSKISELEATLAKVKLESEVALKSKSDEVTKLETALKTANDNITSLASKVTESEKSVSELKVSLENKVKDFDALNEKHTKASAELTKIENENRKNCRITKMVDELGLSKDAANSLFESLASLSDECFNSYVEKTKASLVVKETPAPAPEVTAETVLENAKSEKTEAPVVETEGNIVSAVKEQVINYLKAHKGTPKNKGDK